MFWKRFRASTASSSSASDSRAFPRLRLRPLMDVGGSISFWMERRDFLGFVVGGGVASVRRREALRAAIWALVWARVEVGLVGSGEEEGLREGGFVLGGEARVSFSVVVVMVSVVVMGFLVPVWEGLEVEVSFFSTRVLVLSRGAATTRRVLNLGFLDMGAAGSSPSSPPKDSSAFPPFFFFAAVFFAFAASSSVSVFLTTSRGFISSKGLITTSAPSILTGYTGRSVPSSHSPCPILTRLYNVSPTIFPNIVFLPVNSFVSPNVRKNCEPLSFLRPEFAIPTNPRRLNRSREWNSSAKRPPS